MANKPNDKFFRTPRKAQSVIKASNSLDIAARYLVYKLYEATDGRPMTQWLLGGIGETRETVLRSVELGWVTLHGDGNKLLESSAALTEKGRRLARRGR